MHKGYWLVSFMCFVISACGTSSEQLTSTALTAQTQTAMAVPTATSTPFPTPTIQPTFTPTFTPTPLGGGSGFLLFVTNPGFFRGISAGENDGIYSVNADGSDLKQILSRSQIEQMTGKKYRFAHYYSWAGQDYIFADAVYSVTGDWKLSGKIDLPSFGYLYGFTPDGKYILYIRTDGYLYTSSNDGLETQKLSVRLDEFVGWSADGSTIYFTKNQGANQRAIHIDGSNKRELAMDVLSDYQPYEGISLPPGYPDMGTRVKRLDSYAVSPDTTRVAFTWADLIFVADPADLEFANPQLLMQIPGNDISTSASSLVWSPDNRYLLMGVNRNDARPRETLLVNVQEKRVESVFADRYYSVCGFSPDSQQFSLIVRDWAEKKSELVILSLDGTSSAILMEYVGDISCPTWLLSS